MTQFHFIGTSCGLGFPFLVGASFLSAPSMSVISIRDALSMT
jgi:hypothetical protein